tara:strand:- start:726 stop:1244 length:519 start_codon:yes stop_codon:yes gene_type:complete
VSRIFIKDNFFSEKELNTIKQEMTEVEYVVPPKEKMKQFEGSYWHSHHLPDVCKLKTLIQKLVLKNFFYKTNPKEHECVYTMVGASDRPRPHLDKCTAQCLIYIIGDEKLNNGTGFYKTNKEGSFDLHTHIGFKENRAIFFTAKDNMHSPLHWAEKDNTSWRYSICNFFDKI